MFLPNVFFRVHLINNDYSVSADALLCFIYLIIFFSTNEIKWISL